MNNSEILQKSFDKANKNGWGRDGIKYDGDLSPKGIGWDFMYSVIFSHNFAKAFWGEEEAKIEHQGIVQEYTGQPAWQYHLQQMVLEENPIKYLEKFL